MKLNNLNRNYSYQIYAICTITKREVLFLLGANKEYALNTQTGQYYTDPTFLLNNELSEYIIQNIVASNTLISSNIVSNMNKELYDLITSSENFEEFGVNIDYILSCMDKIIEEKITRDAEIEQLEKMSNDIYADEHVIKHTETESFIFTQDVSFTYENIKYQIEKGAIFEGIDRGDCIEFVYTHNDTEVKFKIEDYHLVLSFDEVITYNFIMEEYVADMVVDENEQNKAEILKQIKEDEQEYGMDECDGACIKCGIKKSILDDEHISDLKKIFDTMTPENLNGYTYTF